MAMIWRILFLVSYFLCIMSRLVEMEKMGPTNRDDSGMVTVKDIVLTSSNMCSSLKRIQRLLNNRVVKKLGITKKIRNIVLPVINPAPILDPLDLWRSLAEVVWGTRSFLTRLAQVPNLTDERVEDAIEEFHERLNETSKKSANLNSVNCTDEDLMSSSTSPDCARQIARLLAAGNPKDELVAELLLMSLFNDSSVKSVKSESNLGGAFLTVGQVMRTTDLLCKRVDNWKKTLNGNGFLGFLKVENTWLPIRDDRFPLDPVLLLDPWGVRRVPVKVVANLNRFLASLLSFRK